MPPPSDPSNEPTRDCNWQGSRCGLVASVVPGLSPVLVTAIFCSPLSALGHLEVWAGAHRPGQQCPKGGARRIGRDVRTGVLHRSDLLKPGCSHRATIIVRKSGKGHSYYLT